MYQFLRIKKLIFTKSNDEETTGLCPQSFLNGAIYVVSKENLENKFIDFKDTSYLVMNKFNSFDLNDYDDLKILKNY